MKKNNKGFTLAEMLIVVAIIGVLIAILVPSFTSQLDKAKIATSQANIRSAIAEATADYLTNGTSGSAVAEVKYALTAAQLNEIGGLSVTSGLSDTDDVTVTVTSDGVKIS